MKKIFFTLAVFSISMAILLRVRAPQTNTLSPSPVLVAKTSPSATIETSTLIVDFGDETKIELKQVVKSDATAYSSLVDALSSKGLDLKTKQYDFGVFVESISGYESSEKMSWIYFINGQSGQVAADKQPVKANDLVEWKYVKPE